MLFKPEPSYSNPNSFKPLPPAKGHGNPQNKIIQRSYKRTPTDNFPSSQGGKVNKGPKFRNV